MKFAATIQYVLVAVLMFGTPSMVLCTSDGGSTVEWALGGSCAPSVTPSTAEAGIGVPKGPCGSCFDIPFGGSERYCPSARPQGFTKAGIPASPAVLSVFLSSNCDFQPDLPPKPPPSADSLRSAVLLI